MRFHADLHVHSKYSRATSRDLDLEHLAYWAARKGIGVVGTGDFTHPAWAAELKQKLVPAQPGLFRLRDEIEQALAQRLPAACRTPVRFLLEVEISTIYKKGERTRKIHHLIYAPDFDAVDRLSARLARIGNIASDGRPILGLDSRDLLEITLEASPDAYLVPAHIWTPWFAVLGSQSGFDSIAECYGDLADHIFAVETGLSSDPAMNWRLSMLDRYRLTSNSDAHSPAKLGREATTFDCELDYYAIRKALETGNGYVGTTEFFPEEGKYHLDGHRKCGARLEPKETLAHGGRCPVCGEPVTVGVLHRVDALADRSEGEARPPATAGKVASLVPLVEVISEIAASGPTSKKVVRIYDKLVGTLGAELDILERVPVEDIARTESSLLAEAISRLRAGKVFREAGYDGEYGVIRLFEEGELAELKSGDLLFDAPVIARKKSAPSTAERAVASPSSLPLNLASPPPERGRSASPAQARGAGRGPLQPEFDPHPARLRPAFAGLGEPPSPFQGEGSARVQAEQRAAPDDGILAQLDADQRAAAEAAEGSILIVAGPGSGKTRTLTHRIAHLVAERGVPAAHCLALTFSRRAAAEMRARLKLLTPAQAGNLHVHTFHSFGLSILREEPQAAGLERGFRVASAMERIAVLAEALDVSEQKSASLLRAISKAKRAQAADAAVAEAAATYEQALAKRNWVDFDDLVCRAVEAMTKSLDLAARHRAHWRAISVDEFQDIDEQQYHLLGLIASPNASLCFIGDPDQAIYGFRGADASAFERFRLDHPDAKIFHLRRNYRSTGTIVAASSQVIASSCGSGSVAEIVREMHDHITIHAAPTEHAEAEFVVATLEQMIGGHNLFSIDSGRASGSSRTELSFSDFAVLYRTEAQSVALVEAFARSGIPFKRNSHKPLAGDAATQALLRELEGNAVANAPVNLVAELQAAVDRLDAGADAMFGRIETQIALQRLVVIAETCADDIARFKDAVALASEADLWDPRADRVSLLTVHAAKGLEFPVVFIVGLEDGLFPLYWGELDAATEAEERRLFYVGMTRAQDQLLLSRAIKRQWRGRVQSRDASPFLADIEQELLKRQQMPPMRRKGEDRQLRLF